MPWFWSNIDWNGTGAMVQAVGSVGAILAAIWIDRGEARRHRREQEAEDRREAVQVARLATVVVSQATYAYRYTLQAQQRIRKPGPPEVPYAEQFEDWRLTAQDYSNALRSLLDRIDDADLFMEAHRFARAAAPPSGAIPPHRRDATIDLCLERMDVCLKGLLERANELLWRADGGRPFGMPSKEGGR